MTSMKCPQCGLVNWATAEACKRCNLPINGADQPAADSWQPTPNSYEAEPVHQWGEQGGYGDQGRYQEPSYAYAGNYAGNVAEAQKTGLAIASMVVGIISMLLCGLLGLGSLTGLVLGIVALVKAKNSPKRFGGQGYAIAGIVLSVISFFYIGIVFAIAIPNLIASYRAANEGSAIRTLQSISHAETIYKEGEAGKYGTLQELAAAGLIDATIVNGARKHYTFEIKTNGATYEALATPVKDNDFIGRSFYYSSEEQFIRAAKKGGVPATAYDPPISQDNEPSYRRANDREPAPPAYQPAYQN